MEHDLALLERAPAGDREQLSHVPGRQIDEKWPLHPRPSLCNDGDIRNVARENDTGSGGSYCRDMTDRTRREHSMKRIAAITAVLAGLAIPSVASAANSTAQASPQVTRQVVQAQMVRTQRANAAVVAQRVSSQRAQAQRFSWQLGLLGR